MNKTRLSGYTAALLVAAVAFGSLNPTLAPPGEHQLDKGVHLLCYGALSVTLYFAQTGRRGAWMAFLLACALGCGLELAQSFTPGREASWLDAAANILGAAIGVSAGMLIRLRLLRC